MRRSNALLVGSFALGALVLVVLSVLWLSGNSLFQHQLMATIHFRGGVAGLYVGAPVTFRGVPVGQVESIDIEVDSRSLDARIPVRVRLNPDSVRFSAGGTEEKAPPDLATLVARGLRAKLVAQSFVTGQKAIDLDFMRDAPAASAGTPSKPEIPAVADRFDALFDQLAQLPLRETVLDLRSTLQQMQAALEETRATVVAARGGIERMTTDLSAVAAQSRRTLTDASSTLAALRRSAQESLASLNRLIEASTRTVDAAQPELQATLASARNAAAAAELAMRRVNELTDPSAPLRGDLDAAVRDLSQASRSLREWSELLEERPNAVIFGRGGRR